MRQFGSSPRMRGTPEKHRLHDCPQRFIPAYAGNAIAVFCGIDSNPVHPRVCGERGDRMVGESFRGGSSPRMRGTLANRHLHLAAIRFIPAYAGNAKDGSAKAHLNSVHPRVCGERKRRIRQSAFELGSSPRMRGTPRPPNTTMRSERFIPAYAGNARKI